MPGQLAGALSWHVLGALLAIVCGNGAALMSASAFRSLGLPRIHRLGSIGLPLVAAVAFAMLVGTRASGTANLLPDGVWERGSVYTITAWEVLTAACLMVGTRRRKASDRPAGLLRRRG